jgi:hypothetical protein
MDKQLTEVIDVLQAMFEPKRVRRDKLANYVGARVTDDEEAWLCAQMKRRRLTMSDLIRLALWQLKEKA